MWVKVLISTIHLDALLFEHKMAAEPHEVVDGHRTTGCHAVAIAFETTGIIRITELHKAFHQGISTEETGIEELELLVGH